MSDFEKYMLTEFGPNWKNLSVTPWRSFEPVFEAGRKAGVDEGRISGLEEAADIVMTNAQPNRLSYAGIATAIREKLND